MVENLLKDKVLLVTGASSGLGKQTAIFFSQQGAKVIITGRNQERLAETLSELQGQANLAISANLELPSEVEALIKNIVSQVGPLDGVVHCAGIMQTMPLKVLKEASFDEVFSANVKSAQFLAKSISRKGRFNPQGLSLIFLSSVAAVCGEPANSVYAASKAALQGLSKSLALELSRLNIRVNCIAPGLIKTDMVKKFGLLLTDEQNKAIADKHPLGLGTPEDVAHAAAFLSSDMARWITGTTLYVDGGYSAH